MSLRSILSPSLALPAGILTIIVLMVMPIPATMLDLFFVLNIALSVAILMAAMPCGASSFVLAGRAGDGRRSGSGERSIRRG